MARKAATKTADKTPAKKTRQTKPRNAKEIPPQKQLISKFFSPSPAKRATRSKEVEEEKKVEEVEKVEKLIPKKEEEEVEYKKDVKKDVKKNAKKEVTKEENEEEMMEFKRKKGQKYAVGTTISKQFDGEDFKGKIIEYNLTKQWYKVRYEDSDEEDLTADEIADLILPEEEGKPVTNAKKRKEEESAAQSDRKRSKEAIVEGEEEEEEEEEKIPKRRKRTQRVILESDEEEEDEEEKKEEEQIKTPSGRPSRRSARSITNYFHKEESDFDDESDDFEEKPKMKSNRRSSTTNKKKVKKQVESDSEASVVSEEEEELDIAMNEVDSADDEMPPPSKRKTPAKKKVASKTKTPASTAKPEKKKMADSFQPLSTPLYSRLSLDEIHAQKEFLDPCGMEATDDVIDRLVGDQVDKLGGLLHRAIQRTVKKTETDKGALGSGKNPLLLGTACSGTDAPALALSIVQEQLELRRDRLNVSKDGDDKIFEYDHVFSCEVDPFKQAYLARNFDSVLYPDIVKLTDKKVRDVYGQEKPLPEFNMFVAGTSCKNFSMLRSNKRIDIEDKGCSGETFLAATEVLFQEKPAYAIFENVIGAPWAKMQEYITGRVKLSDCDTNKAIKDIASKDKGKDLEFIWEEKGKKIVVDRVPPVYGVRAGAVVAGYLKGTEKKVRDIAWPTSKKGTCTLTNLIRENGISKKDDTLVLQTECTYCTHIVKVDTKDYGLPQTRQRTYMFVWRPDDDDNVNDDLGEYWEAIVHHLKSPVRHSLESFILQPDHDIIRVFREALRGPNGRQTKRGVFLEPDFWTSANANLRHNKVAREKLGLDDMARSLTKWGPFGQKQCPPHYWMEYIDCLNQREMDLIEILHASAARDAETHDSNFASFFWNVSQNASKEKHRSACPGIAGCITPGGDFFLPHAGRPLLGCEKLLLQGIPYFRLALGNETEVQIGDLAGNAMSLTVVCATMLAAMSCKQLRIETQKTSHGNMKKVLSDNAGIAPRKKLITSDLINDAKLWRKSGWLCATSLFEKLASLAPDAVKSSIWCTCESSGRNTLGTKFLQCKVCRVSFCRGCINTTSGYQLESHDTAEKNITKEDHNLGLFQQKLRNLVPPSLVFDEAAIKAIAAIEKDRHRVLGLLEFTFTLHRIKRERKKWIIIYYARENNGVGEAVAEFRISVGELKREGIDNCSDEDVELGMRGELTSFFPARQPPLVYGALEPCCMITIHNGESSKLTQWMVKTSNTKTSLKLMGENPMDSERVETGLTDFSAESLVENAKKSHNAKSFGPAKQRGEERRWIYAKTGKTGQKK